MRMRKKYTGDVFRNRLDRFKTRSEDIADMEVEHQNKSDKTILTRFLLVIMTLIAIIAPILIMMLFV